MENKAMNILLIGGGGREHALALGLSKSPSLSKLYCAPGNPGIAAVAECIALDVSDHAAVIAFCKAHDITFVVVGPEAPLVAGLVDDLETVDIQAFGPSRAAAQLEGSKDFTKKLCDEAGIPTAAYQTFSDEKSALDYLAEHPAPIVIKADGLAAGKGVTVAMTQDEAVRAVKECFSGAFGAAGVRVVIEEFMEGEEASFFALSDGSHILPLASAQDHKRVGEGDTGPNTGGMGAYSPAPVLTAELEKNVIENIIKPTVAAMKNRGTPYKGVLYAGLMLTRAGPKLIEYNCRFGDPETQVLIPRLKSDLVELLLACTDGTLPSKKLSWRDDVALTVVMAAKNYPGTVQKGSKIKLPDIEDHNTLVFHAGTAEKDGQLVAHGGRVLNITALAPTIEQAQQRAYEVAGQVDWPEGFYRRDIGWRAVKKTVFKRAAP